MAIRLKVQEDKVTLKVGQGEGATLNAVREERPILVNDYDDLINKPSINGVELEGNLTTEDLHIEAGVTSWNGQTGDVVYEAPVQSVNGQTGAVVLDASDVGALPDDTPIPVDSDLVHKTGAETITGNKTFTNGVEVSRPTSGAILKLSSSAADTNFILERTGGSQCVLESGSSVGLFGTKSNHPLQVRTNYVNRMTFGTDGSVELATAPAASSNNNQVATTKWVNDKGYAQASAIPTKTSDLTNDSGFVNETQAASAAPVQSVNGQTGAVTVNAMPSATGEADGTALVAVDGVWTKQTGYGYKATETGELANYTLTTTAFEPAVIMNAFEPSIGSEYTVVYDGVTYTLTAIADTIQGYGDAVYFGNGQLFGLTGGDPNAPFVYGFILAMQAGGFVTATSGDHTIVNNGEKVVRHNFTLDYVPIENVAGVVQHKDNTDYLGTIGSLRAQDGVSYGFNSTAFGQSLSGGDNSFAEGSGNAIADYSHAEGYNTTASGFYSHAEGTQTVASGQNAAHAEGDRTISSGHATHTEGQETQATGNNSHAEGFATLSSSTTSHAEGYMAEASSIAAHAEGYHTIASGIGSHAEGYLTIAKGIYQHAGGLYNIQDDNNAYAEIIGNGTTENARSNARTLDWSGNEWVAGSMTAAGGFVGNVTGTASGNLPSNTTYAASPAVGGSATFANGIHYGRVDDTSTSTVFTATIPGITSYYDGLTVILYNGKVTSASGFTININGLGALGTYNNMALGNEHTPTAPTRDTTIFNVNYAMILTYCSDIGGQGVAGWICYRGYDANTNTIGYQIRTNSYSLPMTTKVYRYRLLFTSADGEHFVPANGSTSTNATSARTACQDPIDPFGSIVYYGTTAAVDVGSSPSVTNLWQEYVFNLGYSFQKSPNYSLTAWKPVYLKCSPQSDGSAIIYSTDPIV